MRRWPLFSGLAAIALLLGSLGWLFGGWYLRGPSAKDAVFTVPDGASLGQVAAKLEQEHLIGSASAFRLRARLFARRGSIKAGEFRLPRRASPAQIIAILQSGEAVRRFITIPEGMPAILVQERLMAQAELTGPVAIPPEGSVLPNSYDFQKGESRAAVLTRMQTGMTRALAEAWAKRAQSTVAKTPKEAVILASIVEKETGKPAERPMVAGLYSNRLRQGMRLQADPTIIYPITQGKPLGRRILQSEIHAVNGYNTYAMAGLPKGPITNPGRAAIEAVLHPAPTDALYMVADGSGGHAFAATLDQHNANVKKWFALRHARGDF